MGIFLFILSILILIITISKINGALFADEAYSLLITNSTYINAIQATSIDVHPPLYYIILKFFRDFFSSLCINPIIIGNFVSVIPIVFLLIVTITKIRDEFGWLTCGIFALCLTTMPSFMYHTVSIRMYSFGMFFITMEYLYSYSLIKNFNLKNWFILTIFAILASYTHYYGVIASICIYLIIFLYIMIKQKNQLKNIFLSGITIVISYIPWTIVVISQIAKGKKTFWVNNDFSMIFEKIFWYYLSSGSDLSKLFAIILFLAILFLIVYSYYHIKNNGYNNKILFGYCGLIIFILTIILAIIISLLIMPILHERYLFVPIGCLWLGFSIILSNVYNKKRIFIPILIILLCVSSINTIDHVNLSDISEVKMNNLEDIQFNNNDIIIYDTHHTFLAFKMWYTPSVKNYFYERDVIDYNLIDKSINSNGTVYIFQSDTSKTFDEIPSKYKLDLIKTLKKGDPYYDSLPVNIYRLTFK